MIKSRIIEIITKSPKFPYPPAELLDLCKLSFARNFQEREVYPLVVEHRDIITEIVKAKFFNNRYRSNNFKEMIASSHPKDLRNILFTIWLLKFSSAGKYDALKYEIQQQTWLLSAVFGYTLSKYLGVGVPSDFFLQSMLQDISRLALARTVPEIFAKLDKLPLKVRRYEQNEDKSVGVRHADLSAVIVENWGFPEEFCEPIRLHHQVEDVPDMESPDKASALIISFCGRLAEVVMQIKGACLYSEIEDMFARYFRRQSTEFPNFLRMALENAKDYSQPLGLHKLPNFSGLRVLKENTEFLRRRLIPYEEMLDELVGVYERLEVLEAEVERNQVQQSEYVLRDILTGLYNHAYFEEALRREIAQSNRYEHPISIIVFDVDNFRQFNQAHGLVTGNAILQEISVILKKNLRESDLVARYGNDEFAIVVSRVGAMRSNVIAEKLRRRVAEHQFANPQRDLHHKVTISLGYASYDPTEKMIGNDDLLREAMQALKKAREAGGNCCMAAVSSHIQRISAE